MRGITRAARWVAGALAGLSVRDLAGALAMTLVMVAALCWVLRDEDRSRRLAEIIGAWRGDRSRTSSQPAEKPPERQRRAAAAGSGSALPGSGTPGTG